MLVKRSLPVSVILSIITCGLYSLYWYVCLIDETKSFTGDKRGFSGIVTILLSIITCGLYGFYAIYTLGDSFDQYVQAYGYNSQSRGVLYLVLALFSMGIIPMILAQKDLNDVCDGRYCDCPAFSQK